MPSPIRSRPAALITGASGGIGRATGQAFGKIGWYVGIHYYLNKPEAEATLTGVFDSGGHSEGSDLES